MRTMKREPVVIINAVVTAIQASIPLVLAFGIAHMTREEGAAISSAVVAWGGLLATFLGRSLVTPVAYPKDHEGRSLRAGVASTSADKERPIPARRLEDGESALAQVSDMARCLTLSPLSGVKRKSDLGAIRSAFDPKQKSRR
jgi:hypothetical protein